MIYLMGYYVDSYLNKCGSFVILRERFLKWE